MRYKKVTFLTAMELWRRKAELNKFSPKTVKNTQTHLQMLERFMSKEMSLKHFTVGEYERVLTRIMTSGYSPETVYDLNATLRKLINLAFKRHLIARNILPEVDILRIESRREVRVIPREHFEKIVLATERESYRFLWTLLYYAGLRIGEALALETADFVEVGGILRVKISKSYLYDFKLTKSTKNRKVREIPLSGEVFGEFLRANEARRKTPTKSAKIFAFSPQAARAMLHKICDELGLPRYRLHEFRHTFVSSLMRAGVPIAVVAQVSGDTQTTLLKRYSHMFPNDEQMILEALCASGHAAKPARHAEAERLLGTRDRGY
ncbi:site-specific integrase [Candidatus Saccharibacteria bacterium]|nr:site-specific integrase [Candidatus Saccharibacteria bacterium]